MGNRIKFINDQLNAIGGKCGVSYSVTDADLAKCTVQVEAGYEYRYKLKSGTLVDFRRLPEPHPGKFRDGDKVTPEDRFELVKITPHPCPDTAVLSSEAEETDEELAQKYKTGLIIPESVSKAELVEQKISDADMASLP